MIRALPALFALALASDATGAAAPEDGRPAVLRVCADPNNLPFSNQAGEGFENRIAALVADELGAELEYVWWAQRRGFLRNTLGAGLCDLVPGVPAGLDAVATTEPYYRSTHVFVTRRDLGPPIESFDDPRLRRLRIGVHVIGDDYANPPPVAALARRGIVRNVSGYSIYGDYREPDPPARLVEAVSSGTVDVAIVWGPLGGYFAGRDSSALQVTPVRAQAAGEGVPFEFAIAMGLRRADATLRRDVDAALARHRDAIRRILEEYRVPLVPPSPEAT